MSGLNHVPQLQKGLFVRSDEDNKVLVLSLLTKGAPALVPAKDSELDESVDERAGLVYLHALICTPVMDVTAIRLAPLPMVKARQADTNQ